MIARHPVVLIRHGETEWSAQGRHTGRTDIELTELGRRQADMLGALLTGPYSMVLSSPLRRAAETMERSGLGSIGVLDADLVEWDYGIYEGRTTADIRRETPGWSVWSSPIRGGESVEAVAERADRVIRRATGAGGPVVLFSHAHLLRVLAARWVGAAADLGRLLVLDTASVSELSWDRELPVIRHWNELCHLRPPSTLNDER